MLERYNGGLVPLHLALAVLEDGITRTIDRCLSGQRVAADWYTPTKVRKMAACSMARVTEAIRSGELPATKAKPVRGGIGGKLAYSWRIKAEDAKAWVERVEQERHGISDPTGDA